MTTTETVVHSIDKIAGPVTVYRLRVDGLVYRVAFYAKTGTYIVSLLCDAETSSHTVVDWRNPK